MKTVEKLFLEHFGIKGMKWGVRRADPGPGSSDHEEVVKVKAKSKAGGVRSLSNTDIQKLVTRMNLEKQYSTLNPNGFDKAKKIIDSLLGLGGTANQVMGFVNSPSGKLIKDGFKK